MTLVVCLGTPEYGFFISFLKNLKITFIRSHPHKVYYEKHPPFGWMFFIVYFMGVGSYKHHFHFFSIFKQHPQNGVLYHNVDNKAFITHKIPCSIHRTPFRVVLPSISGELKCDNKCHFEKKVVKHPLILAPALWAGALIRGS